MRYRLLVGINVRGGVLKKCAGAAAVAVIAAGACAAEAGARVRLRPRIGPAMGIIPPVGEQQEIAVGSNLPVVYHGGQVMRGPVRIHTVFWAPPGYRFTGSPGAGILGYEPMIEQFLSDSASDSNSLGNAFSVLREYPDRFGPGRYALSYRPGLDSIDDHHSYPPRRKQCASPSGTATCVTDLEVQRELDRLIGARPPHRVGRGLNDLWFVLLPPNVDTCIAPDACGSNAFAGYHSLSNVGHGPVIYSLIIDPLIELPNIPGADPRGNPEAESSIDTVAHEAVEAITDPKGVGWMDPNGFEVADKCEDGPQVGTPLGSAPNGSVYNQLIAGHQYLIQGMWSNTRQGCVTRSRSSSSPLPLPAVSLDQFSSLVRGRIGVARGGVSVRVSLSRAGVVVARGSGRTRADGSWGPVSLGSHAVGDDRDVIVVRYGRGGGGPEPNTQRIETGSGGNPFTASGWTGWFALDHGYQVRRSSILLSPCAQTGVLRVLVNGSISGSPLDVCQTETDVSVVPTPRIATGTSLRMSSEDNRASTLSNGNGALVKLTIPVGEPGAITSVENDQIFFEPSGFPSCTAELRIQMVRCSGLLPGTRYTAVRRRGRPGGSPPPRAVGHRGAVMGLGIRGGDVVALSNRAGRVLSTLHVAHLRVDVLGRQTVISSGRCQPGEYYGPPLQQPPTSGAVGSGASGAGTICPLDGDAAGLAASQIVQSDEFSGGMTATQVPLLEGTAPADDATLYGPFVALARTGLPGAHGSVIPAPARVTLTIYPGGGGGPVFRASNVASSGGVPVRGLPAGAYRARWVVVDANGDTRTVTTHFVEAG